MQSIRGKTGLIIQPKLFCCLDTEALNQCHADHASRLGVQERKSDVNAFDVFETMDVRQNQLVDISTMDVRQNQCADLLKVCTVSTTVVIPTQKLGNWELAAPPKRERGAVR